MTTRLEMLVTDIVVGTRARGDVGDLASLKRSITELGLLQPVGVRIDGTLVFGGRRLAAAKELGLASIPVVVTSDADDELTALRAEMEENVERLQFTAVEAATLRRRLRTLASEQKKELRDRPTAVVPPEAAPAAEDAPATHTPVGGTDAPARATAPSVADLDAQLAQATGYSLTTLKRVERISEFTTCGDPDTEEAARDALKRIDAGAPVMPLLGQVLAIYDASTATRDLPQAAPAAEASTTPQATAAGSGPEPAAEAPDAAMEEAAADDDPMAEATAPNTDPRNAETTNVLAVEEPGDLPDPGAAQISPLLPTRLAPIFDALPRATVADLPTLDDVIIELERALDIARERVRQLRNEQGGAE